MNESCEYCKYWKQVTQVKFEGKKKVAGQCRINPPKAFTTVLETGLKQSVRYRFPFTAIDDWCGEFKQKQ